MKGKRKIETDHQGIAMVFVTLAAYYATWLTSKDMASALAAAAVAASGSLVFCLLFFRSYATDLTGWLMNLSTVITAIATTAAVAIAKHIIAPSGDLVWLKTALIIAVFAICAVFMAVKCVKKNGAPAITAIILAAAIFAVTFVLMFIAFPGFD